MMKKSLFIFVSALLLSSCSAPVKVTEASTAKTYSTFLNKNIKHVDNAIYSPTLILNGDKSAELTNKQIQNSYYDVLINVENDLTVNLDNSKVDLTVYLDTYIKGKYVPIVKLTDSNVDAFIDYFKYSYTYLDLIVMSKSLSVLDKLYKDDKTHILSSVYDISDQKLEANQFENWKYVKEANKVGSNILLINGKDENLKVGANYISSMTKAAWAISEDEVMDVNIPTSGCNGIISNDPMRTLATLEKLNKVGRLSPQKLSAHRGITGYANENSLSSCMFAYSEGASHIEIDLQICADEEIVLCHNSQTNYNSDKNGWYFVNLTYEQLQKATLNDYCDKYQETYSKLTTLIEHVMYLDMIVICELKFDNGSSKAINDLECIENLKKIMDRYPDFFGHWFAITFFAPLAEKMKEIMPEVPVGYLGGGQSGLEKDNGVTPWNKGGGHKNLLDYANKIKFLRYYNLALDETFDEKNSSGEYYFDLTCDFYMARGYLQNTWTYENINHLNNKTNIATSNAVEKCASIIKEFSSSTLNISLSEYYNGKVKVSTLNYNRWVEERECEIITIKSSDFIYAVLFYQQTVNSIEYGLYSNIIKINIL